jgi:hypothetical protein
MWLGRPATQSSTGDIVTLPIIHRIENRLAVLEHEMSALQAQARTLIARRNVLTYSERALYVKVNRALKDQGHGAKLRKEPGVGHQYYVDGVREGRRGVRDDLNIDNLHEWAANNMPWMFGCPKRERGARDSTLAYRAQN